MTNDVQAYRDETPEDFAALIAERVARSDYLFNAELLVTHKHIDAMAAECGDVFLIDLGCWMGLWTEKLCALLQQPLLGRWLIDAGQSFIAIAQQYINDASFSCLSIALDKTAMVRLKGEIGRTIFYTTTKPRFNPGDGVVLRAGPAVYPDEFAQLVAWTPRPRFLKIDINCWEQQVVEALLGSHIAVDGLQIKVANQHVLRAVNIYLDWLGLTPIKDSLPIHQYATVMASNRGSTILFVDASTASTTHVIHTSSHERLTAKVNAIGQLAAWL